MIPFQRAPFLGLDQAVGSRLGTLVSNALDSLQESGYSVLISDTLEDLDSFRRENAEHPDCRSPNTAFDLHHHPNETGAQGLFLTKHGRRVGTVWRRIIPLRIPRSLDTMTLEESFTSLRAFYDDPLDAPRRESCTLNSDLIRTIYGGAYCYCGWAWHQPQHRGLGLFKHIADLSLVLSITSADQWDWFVALIRDTSEAREFSFKVYPYLNFTRRLVHNGEDYILCTASYREARDIALKAAE